jgi:ankyrin repeat protein
MTALLHAAWMNSNPAVVTALLKAGADIRARNARGETALILAAQKNTNPDVIVMLLRAGADAKIKNNDGKTAFDCAKDNDKLNGTDAHWKLNEALY